MSQVSTLELFKTILDEQKSFPREQPYKDLIALITYILRKFFKAVEEDNFLIVEAFYPKNRGKWKALSSWEPPARDPLRPEPDSIPENRWPADVRVKKGYSWEEQLAITVKCLVEDEKESLVRWVKEVCTNRGRQNPRTLMDATLSDPEFRYWSEEAHCRGYRWLGFASHGPHQ